MAFRSNCLFWALHRRVTKGGHIMMRRSLHSRWVPHFLWSQDLKRWYGFTPLKPRHGIRALLHCWWFTGSVVSREESR